VSGSPKLVIPSLEYGGILVRTISIGKVTKRLPCVTPLDTSGDLLSVHFNPHLLRFNLSVGFMKTAFRRTILNCDTLARNIKYFFRSYGMIY
jgi:hypothetical protein